MYAAYTCHAKLLRQIVKYRRPLTWREHDRKYDQRRAVAPRPVNNALHRTGFVGARCRRQVGLRLRLAQDRAARTAHSSMPEPESPENNRVGVVSISEARKGSALGHTSAWEAQVSGAPPSSSKASVTKAPARTCARSRPRCSNRAKNRSLNLVIRRAPQCSQQTFFLGEKQAASAVVGQSCGVARSSFTPNISTNPASSRMRMDAMPTRWLTKKSVKNATMIGAMNVVTWPESA